MTIDDKVYTDSDEFFALDGNAVMRLSGQAAIQACCDASKRSKIVVRVEGGVWQNPGFMSRIDCIWDGTDPPLSQAKAYENNLDAANFIQQSSDAQDTFILTVTSLGG